MSIQKHFLIFTILLVLVISTNFVSVRVVQADGETPTEPAAPTEVATEPPTEPPAESTPEPVEAAPEPVETTATPLAEVLSDVPENTEVVVLDENGDSVPLASQEATEIAELTDPVWCPAGVLPGGVGSGCSSNFLTIGALINHMRNNPSNYDEAGVIYFTIDPGTQSFLLTDAPTSLASSFDTLKGFDLTLQGGWNGSSVSPPAAIIGQTNFGNRSLTIGTVANPWIGNLTLNDLTFSNSSSTSLTIYTTTGDITLNNVDVDNQQNGGNTALLQSTSGDIAVTDGIYDGNNSNSTGFSATTNSGSITISDTFFTENRKSTNNPDGATLSAPTITLTNVTATQNDGDGISLLGADIVTLNNVVASNNGTDPPGPVSNDGSGVFFSGNLGAGLFVNGGAFDNNKEYGIEFADPATTTLNIVSAPNCTGNASGCTNAVDATPPTLSLPADITTTATGPSGAVVNFSASATDNIDPVVGVTCLPSSGSTFPAGSTTVSCSATDTAGNTAVGSFQVIVQDMPVTVTPTPPTPTPPTPTPPTPTPPTPASPTPPSPTSPTATPPGSTNSDSTTGSSAAPFELIIPVTGGKVIRLDCNSVFWAFGIKLSFTGLCDYQTTLDDIGSDELPGGLPDGHSFVMGLDLRILKDNEAIEELPDGASVLLDFPLLGDSGGQFAVVHWNGNEWVEVSQQAGGDQNFYQISTTDQTGIFVLVKK